MPNPELFEKIDRKNDPYRVAKDAFNAIAGTGFIDAVETWMRGISVGNDGGSIDFPEDDDDFDGILCSNYWEEEQLLTEEEFYNLLSEAVQRYIELHPDRRDKLEQMLS